YPIQGIGSFGKINGLTLQTSKDDWFSFTLDTASAVTDNVRLRNLDPTGPAMTLALVDAMGMVMRSVSVLPTASDMLSLKNLPAGTYWLHVTGDGVKTGHYELLPSVGATAATSVLTLSNDTQATAYPIADILSVGLITGLTLGTKSDEDWF